MSIEIEIDLSGNAVPDYAMYTEQLAESNEDLFGEAMDTMVRECVYDTLGCAQRGENFYA